MHESPSEYNSKCNIKCNRIRAEVQLQTGSGRTMVTTTVQLFATCHLPLSPCPFPMSRGATPSIQILLIPLLSFWSWLCSNYYQLALSSLWLERSDLIQRQMGVSLCFASISWMSLLSWGVLGCPGCPESLFEHPNFGSMHVRYMRLIE